jgi:hypothetical protein
MKFWHGTPNEESCAQITRERVLRSLEDPYSKYKGSISTPMTGRVYVSKDPNYALIYAIGGDYAGTSLPVDGSRYGCLFEVDVPADADIVLDEDELGELAAEEQIAWLSKLAREVSSGKMYGPRLDRIPLWAAAKDGDYGAWIDLGHRLHKVIRPSDMRRLFEYAKNYAVLGPVRVLHGYRIDKQLTPKMRRGDIESTLELSERLF